VECFIFLEMDNNFKFKTKHVSIVQRSSSVMNSFTSLVELIQAMAYKLKRDTIENSKKITYNFKKREACFICFAYRKERSLKNVLVRAWLFKSKCSYLDQKVRLACQPFV